MTELHLLSIDSAELRPGGWIRPKPPWPSASDVNCGSWRIRCARNIIKCAARVEHVDQSQRCELNGFAENLVQETEHFCKTTKFTVLNKCWSLCKKGNKGKGNKQPHLYRWNSVDLTCHGRQWNLQILVLLKPWKRTCKTEQGANQSLMVGWWDGNVKT